MKLTLKKYVYIKKIKIIKDIRVFFVFFNIECLKFNFSQFSQFNYYLSGYYGNLLCILSYIVE